MGSIQGGGGGYFMKITSGWGLFEEGVLFADLRYVFLSMFSSVPNTRQNMFTLNDYYLCSLLFSLVEDGNNFVLSRQFV